jgi:hypothetical protein
MKANEENLNQVFEDLALFGIRCLEVSLKESAEILEP